MTERKLLEVTDLSVAYGDKKSHKWAVRNANLTVETGKITGIVGESGSGKSTLARAVVGLLPGNGKVHGGSVRFGGRELLGLKNRDWYDLRGRDIGWIPQDPTLSLNPMKSIGNTVAEALKIHGWGDPAKRRQRVLELLERVGLDNPELRAGQFPHQLSGGMKQRVLIASALALKPRLVIADEPTSALDVTVQKTILDLLDEMREDLNTAVLLITHDLAVAGERADHLVVMEQSKVREAGHPTQVLGRPQHVYTRQLLADAPSFSAAPIGPVQTVGGVLLRVQNLRQEFVGPQQKSFLAVDDVSFDVNEGATHGIVGESGSGKTTTGRAIAMFQKPTAGTITLGRKNLLGLSKREQRNLRPEIQLVHQNPANSLSPRQKIGQIIGEPLRNYREHSRVEIDRRVRELLDLVGLPQASAVKRSAELSGGQLQRVAIARALILDPKLVVFDEAVSALDVTVQAQILRLLRNLQDELKLTYIFISHDLAVMRQIAQTVSVLKGGQQVEGGPTERVLLDPQHPYTQSLIGAVPRGLPRPENQRRSRQLELAAIA